VLLIVSSVRLERGADAIEARRADGGKCARCWCFDPAVGNDPEHPELCPRCAGVVRSFISE
jgi:isoleucyl-tRNA synthetase